MTKKPMKFIEGWFLNKQCRTVGHPYMHFYEKKKQNRKDVTSFTKTDSKWIMGVNVKHKTINFLKENIGEGSYAHHHATKTEK